MLILKKIKLFFELIKIKHWVKNLFIFAPIIFALKLFDINSLLRTFLTFAAFSLCNVLTYVINDVKDLENDKKHPRKSGRPIASGRISRVSAVLIGVAFFTSVSVIAFSVDFKIFVIILLYLILNLFYSFVLKHIVILDVFIIAVGFCIRVFAGSAAIDVALSDWMLLATFCISLLIGFGKRRNEIETLGDEARHHRKNLSDYNKKILDIMIIISCALTAFCYALYTMEDSVVARYGSGKLIFTTPIVLYGIYRYLLLIYVKGKGGNPEELVVTDKGILFSVVLWVASVVFIIYYHEIIGFFR